MGVLTMHMQRWFHALPGSYADLEMRRMLHKQPEAATTLNVYTVDAGQTFGWATFPWWVMALVLSRTSQGRLEIDPRQLAYSFCSHTCTLHQQ